VSTVVRNSLITWDTRRRRGRREQQGGAVSYARYRTLQTPEIQPSSRRREHRRDSRSRMRSSSVLAFRTPARRSGGVRKCRGCARGPTTTAERVLTRLLAGASVVANLAAGRPGSHEWRQPESSLRSSRRARGGARAGGIAAPRTRRVAVFSRSSSSILATLSTDWPPYVSLTAGLLLGYSLAAVMSRDDHGFNAPNTLATPTAAVGCVQIAFCRAA
jgi:hypothetical protein